MVILVYLYGGVHGLIWVLSKTIVMPMFQQLVNDRHEYHCAFLNHLQAFTSRISCLVPYIPPITALNMEHVNGPKYTDAQMQTEEQEEQEDDRHDQTAINSPYYSSASSSCSDLTALAATERRKQRKSKSLSRFGTNNSSSCTLVEHFNVTGKSLKNVQTYFDNGYYSHGIGASEDLLDIRTAAEKANDRAEEFTDAVKELANTINTLDARATLGYSYLLKYRLENLSAYGRTLSQQKLTGSGSGPKTKFEEIRKEMLDLRWSLLRH